MKRVRLTRVKSNHENLRTQQVEGILLSEVEIGQRLFLMAKPLNSYFTFRQVMTSPIVSLRQEEDNLVRVETENSVYQLEYLEESLG